MRPAWLFLPAAAFAAGWIAGGRREAPEAGPRVAPAPRPETVEHAPAVAARPPTVPTTARREPALRELPKLDVRERLARFKKEDVDKLEEELEARLLEDREFAARLFEAFRAETDAVKMSFLANVLASDPHLRNSEEWQDRFLKVAEADGSFERRASSLLFLQQAESTGASFDRLLALADADRNLCPNALAALRGLPDRRTDDPRVSALAGRIADRETDPALRGLALRIEADPAHAAAFLSDSDRTVRMQACRVVTSREPLIAAMKIEQDSEVRGMLQYRLEELK